MREIGALIDSGAIRPVVDRVFPFESTKEALAYVEKGRAKGKVIVKVRSSPQNVCAAVYSAASRTYQRHQGIYRRA